MLHQGSMVSPVDPDLFRRGERAVGPVDLALFRDSKREVQRLDGALDGGGEGGLGAAEGGLVLRPAEAPFAALLSSAGLLLDLRGEVVVGAGVEVDGARRAPQRAPAPQERGGDCGLLGRRYRWPNGRPGPARARLGTAHLDTKLLTGRAVPAHGLNCRPRHGPKVI